MKILKGLIIVALCVLSCKQNNAEVVEIKKNDKTPVKQKQLAEDTVPLIAHNQNTYEHHLSLYNENYVLQIQPAFKTANNTLAPKLLLYKNATDTIFNRQIGIETIVNYTNQNNILPENITLFTLRNQYKLDKIVFHNFRANKLYFEATLVPKTNSQQPTANNLKAIFNLQYLEEKNYGKLTVNMINTKGWGRNKGDDPSFNKIVKTNPDDCGISENSITKEKASEEHATLVTKIKQLLAANSNAKTKHHITFLDTLEVTETIRFNNKTEYNRYKMPMNKLADVSKSGNKITLYTKWKAINVNRFGYKPLQSGQFDITSILSKEKTQKLYIHLKRLSQLNCFLETLE